MDIYPAIDLKDGRVVRLTRGDYDTAEVYADDPAAVARSFAEKGARFLHVVDLDGAKDGALSNYDAVRSILAATDMFVEIGGGVRDERRVRAYLDAGAGRVILGSAAVKNFPFLCDMAEKYGEQIALGVDARDGMVATDGWLETSREEGVAFCRRAFEHGVKSVIYTDIARDGAMQGTNLEVYPHAAARSAGSCRHRVGRHLVARRDPRAAGDGRRRRHRRQGGLSRRAQT